MADSGGQCARLSLISYFSPRDTTVISYIWNRISRTLSPPDVTLTIIFFPLFFPSNSFKFIYLFIYLFIFPFLTKNLRTKEGDGRVDVIPERIKFKVVFLPCESNEDIAGVGGGDDKGNNSGSYSSELKRWKYTRCLNYLWERGTRNLVQIINILRIVQGISALSFDRSSSDATSKYLKMFYSSRYITSLSSPSSVYFPLYSSLEKKEKRRKEKKKKGG